MARKSKSSTKNEFFVAQILVFYDNQSMSNEKHERFQKIAEARTNKVINDLRILSNCANTHNYTYTKEEAVQILKAIDEAVRDLKIAFASKGTGSKSFSFKK